MNKILVIILIGIFCVYLNIISCEKNASLDGTSSDNKLVNKIKRGFDSDELYSSKPTYTTKMSDEEFIRICNEGEISEEDKLTPHQYELYLKCKLKRPFTKISELVRKHKNHQKTKPSSKM